MTSSPVSSRWTPPGQVPGLVVGGEEPLELGQDVVEAPRLATAVAREGVAVHRVTRPHHRMVGVADGLEQRRQRVGDRGRPPSG